MGGLLAGHCAGLICDSAGGGAGEPREAASASYALGDHGRVRALLCGPHAQRHARFAGARLPLPWHAPQDVLDPCGL